MIRYRLLVSILFLIAATYLTWCVYRFSHAAFVHDKSFPRAWPYPDRFLLALDNYYDNLYPAPDGYIKIHSEITRVQATFSAPAIVLVALSIALAAPEVWHTFWRFVEHHKLSGKCSASRIGDERQLTTTPPIRFRLCTLLILLAVAPCILAWLSHAGIGAIAVFGLTMLPQLLLVWAVLLGFTLVLQRLRY